MLESKGKYPMIQKAGNSAMKHREINHGLGNSSMDSETWSDLQSIDNTRIQDLLLKKSSNPAWKIVKSSGEMSLTKANKV